MMSMKHPQRLNVGRPLSAPNSFLNNCVAVAGKCNKGGLRPNCGNFRASADISGKHERGQA